MMEEPEMSTTIEPAVKVETRQQPLPPRERLERIFQIENLDALYSGKAAVKGVTLEVYKNLVTAIIGPSGCGKSTFIRCLNRMNDLVPGFTMNGTIRYHGQDICGSDIDPVAVRRHIGMVFQRPNPFPTMSIRDNVASGLRLNGVRSRSALDEKVERSLTLAGLWEEVKNRLDAPGAGLSGGQQQRLCIARAIAVDPDVILMDEPCSALDPISTLKIEDLMVELKSRYTVVVVTHNMQQAARVSDTTAFFNVDGVGEPGRLVEVGNTSDIFTTPKDSRTEAYITGRFG
jgi:phosphate transport system ATP-binding protein